ncbi:signal peptidase I [candidate division KSB1 bacterium]|nr:signal peptidase I [candidate division KSB1 bacterium]
MNPKTSEKQAASAKQADQTHKKKTKKKSGLQEFIESIGVALIAAFILRIFLVQSFKIPTGSMKDTLMIGDMLLVNKFIYGVRTPNRIPFTDIKIPYIRLPGFRDPKRGNIVVFKFPDNPGLDYIKRCVGVGGQTLEVRHGWVYIDGVIEGKRKKIVSGKFDNERSDQDYFDYYEIRTDWGDTYTVRQRSNYEINLDNFGPVRIPRKGQTIHFPLKNEDEVKLYRKLIVNREKHTFQETNDSRLVVIDGKVTDSYTVEEDYYFMMGDNRDNSSDSRDWGFMPRENVVGEALIIFFSYDANEPFYDLSSLVRWSRIGMIIR